MRLYILVFAFLSLGTAVWAQTGTLSGTIVDGETGEPLVGANVVISETLTGAVTDFDGKFTLVEVPAGKQVIVITYLGYESYTYETVIMKGDAFKAGKLEMNASSVGLSEVQVISSVAIDRKTPVAVATIKGAEIEAKLGNQEFPEILKSTPSVYTTKSGGGFGDGRINVRGFDQRNVAVMINGIPVNDMENGWVYWSNWAGLSDVTSNMQVQRGLGASKLAISSVGGTINIITKTTEAKKGGAAGFWVGNDGYLKGSLSYHTGLMKGGWAVSLQGTRTQGDGYVDATYIDAWSYFLSVAKEVNKDHRLVFTAIGAPQKHGQRSFRESLETYQENGTRYNSDWGMRDGERFNIRENFYHKPQMALNHYWNINQSTFLSTSAYLSFGRGGGTGDRGSIGGKGTWGFRDGDGLIRIDDIVAWNRGGTPDDFPDQGNINQSEYGYVAGENTGLIKRASMNEHNWMGVLSTLKKELTDDLSLMVGVDVRGYKGLHYRRVEDLMGNDYWLDSRDVNGEDIEIDLDGDGEIGSREVGELKQVGDKIHYDNDGLVGWQGLFGQLEYSVDDGLTVFGAASVSNTSHKRVDRFNYTPEEGQTSDAVNYIGYTFKGGANYNINRNHNVFVNAGLFSRAPDFDGTFPVFTNEINENVNNEKVVAFEAGYGLRIAGFSANLNYYNTNWKDKSFYRSYFNVDPPFTASIAGLDANHSGIEFDANYRLNQSLTIRGMASLGNWKWQNNVDAIVSDDNNMVLDTVTVFADGLKVGDAAQTTFALGIDWKADFGLGLSADYNMYDNLYGLFDPVERIDPELTQPYKLPSYGLLDLGLSYRLPFDAIDATVRVNAYNVLDEEYVAEANDGSVENDEYLNLSGLWGFGRTWTAGLKVRF